MVAKSIAARRNVPAALAAGLMMALAGVSDAAAAAAPSAAATPAPSPPATPAPSGAEAGWKLAAEEDGIRVEERQVEGSPLVEFRSSAQVEAPILLLSAILWDANRGCEWMEGCAQSFVIERTAPRTALLYSRIKVAPLIADRDLVMATKIAADEPQRSAALTFHDIADARKPPTSGVVRMRRVEGSFVLRQLAPRRTEVTYQVLSDPVVDAVPAFIVNAVARQVPLNTLKRLRTQAHRDGYGPVCTALRASLGCDALWRLEPAP